MPRLLNDRERAPVTYRWDDWVGQNTQHKINNFRKVINLLNAELNPICHLLALLAHHILHVTRVRVKGHFDTLNAELNPICHLLPLLAHHILHVSGLKVKGLNVTYKA